MSDLSKKLSGRFIVIDGPDGSGKTTQVELLADYLRGEGVVVHKVRDPGGTAIGEKIRQILLDNSHSEMSIECEMMLYMASRAQLATETIRPALRRGECVLSDRFISATIAYQGAGGLDPAAIRTVGRAAVGKTLPDLTVILDLPAETGLGRLTDSPDRIEARDLQFHRKVRELFAQQAADDPARFTVVDASGSIEEIQQRLRETIGSWEFGR